MNAALVIVVFVSRVCWTSSFPTEVRQCRPGFFYNVTRDLCQVCPSGMYTESYNLNSHCNHCSRCTGLHVMVSVCNASSDTVCTCPDGYYEHDDGCSPKSVAYVEERSSGKLEWTWTQSLLIVTFVAVIILAISFTLHCCGVTMKLPSCQRKCKEENDNSTSGQQQADLRCAMTLSTLASKDQEKINSFDKAPNQLNKPPNSGECRSPPPNGTTGSAASASPINNLLQQGSEASVAACGGTLAPNSRSGSGLSVVGAEGAGAPGGAAETPPRISVQVHPDCKPDCTPETKLMRSESGDAADSQQRVELPIKTVPGALAPVEHKAAASATQRCTGSDLQDGCTKCVKPFDPFTGMDSSQQLPVGNVPQQDCASSSETNGFLTAGTQDCAEDDQKSSTVVDTISSENAHEILPLLEGHHGQ